jgi:hypothetical protein
MMRSSGSILFTIVVLTLTMNACKDHGEPIASIPLLPGPPTSYSYNGYNSKGQLVVVGSMTLAVTDSRIVSGRWNLECITPGEKVGPQTGNGTLSGNIDGASVSINLNPGWVDNNVFLFGSFDKGRFSGTWTWSTFIGPTSAGSFEALQVR